MIHHQFLFLHFCLFVDDLEEEDDDDDNDDNDDNNDNNDNSDDDDTETPDHVQTQIPSHPGIKYPVRGIPPSDLPENCPGSYCPGAAIRRINKTN